MQRLFFDVDRSGKWLMGGNHDGLVSAWNVSMDQDDGAHFGECNELQHFDGSVQSLSHTWRQDVTWRAGTGEFCSAKSTKVAARLKRTLLFGALRFCRSRLYTSLARIDPDCHRGKALGRIRRSSQVS